MYWGDEKKDILSLNHERLWSAKYKGKEPEVSFDKLAILRQLLEKRDYFSNHYYLTEVTVQAPVVWWDYANEHILIITIKTFDGAFYKHTIDIYQGYRKNSNS